MQVVKEILLIFGTTLLMLIMLVEGIRGFVRIWNQPSLILTPDFAAATMIVVLCYGIYWTRKRS